MTNDHPRSSRQRYRRFVEDYRLGRLDDVTEARRDGQAGQAGQTPGVTVAPAEDAAPRRWWRLRRGTRREYLREYLRWLAPYRTAVVVHIGQAVMALGGTVDYLVEAVFNYPTLAESYKVAALDATNKLRAISTLTASAPT